MFTALAILWGWQRPKTTQVPYRRVIVVANGNRMALLNSNWTVHGPNFWVPRGGEGESLKVLHPGRLTWTLKTTGRGKPYSRGPDSQGLY